MGQSSKVRMPLARPASDDDYNVLAEGIVVGRIMQAAAAAPLASVEA